MKNIFYSLFIFFTINSCKTSRTNTSTFQKNQLPPNSILENTMIKNGIDFLAEGNSPSNWTLQMNIDDTIRFIAEDGLAVKFAYNQLKKDVTAETIFYKTKLKTTDISIIVKQAECNLASHNNKQSRQVIFTFNNISYSGCGRYLTNNKLHAKWVLEKIGNTLINQPEYKNTPLFELDLFKNTLSGNNGCATLKGKFEVQGKRIQFYTIATNNVNCTKKSIANIIEQQINNKLVDYYFKDGKLYLYLSDDNLLVFIKN